MMRFCCVCKKVFGEKEPLEDRLFTDGYCNSCFANELEKIKNYHEGGVVQSERRLVTE